MPVLLDDTQNLRVATGAIATGNMLSNDPDSAGSLSVDGVPATAAAQTIAGDHGYLSFAADGGYTYTPFAWTRADMTLALGGTQRDSFSYTVSDGGLSSTVNLNIDMTVLRQGDVGTTYGSTGNRAYTTSAGADAQLLGYTGGPGNGTFTEIAYDFAGEASWQAAWVITPSAPEQAFNGMLNDDGSISQVIQSTSASDGWVARVLTGAGLASELQATQIATAGSTAYTWAAIAEEENNAPDLLTQGADIESVTAGLGVSTGYTSIVTYTDDGQIETTGFDFINNPDETYTASVTDLTGTALGNLIYRTDGLEIFNAVPETPAPGDGSPVIRGDQLVTDTADAFVWETQSRSFDVNGLARNVATLDSGDIITTDYGIDGSTTRTFEDITDTRGWALQTESRDAQGVLTADSFVFDDGLMLSRSYDAAGNLASRTRTDGGDNRAWESVSETFDEGTLSALSVTQDDGDIVVRDYDSNGVLTTRSFFDVADNFPWENRVWNYDTDGTLLSVETDALLLG